MEDYSDSTTDQQFPRDAWNLWSHDRKQWLSFVVGQFSPFRDNAAEVPHEVASAVVAVNDDVVMVPCFKTPS